MIFGVCYVDPRNLAGKTMDESDPPIQAAVCWMLLLVCCESRCDVQKKVPWNPVNSFKVFSIYSKVCGVCFFVLCAKRVIWNAAIVEVLLLKGRMQSYQDAALYVDIVDGRNPANQLMWLISYYLQGFIHVRWLFTISEPSRDGVNFQISSIVVVLALWLDRWSALWEKFHKCSTRRICSHCGRITNTVTHKEACNYSIPLMSWQESKSM